MSTITERRCSDCGEMFHGPVCYSTECLRTCAAKYVNRCTLAPGHTGPHRDWTDYTWSDK